MLLPCSSHCSGNSQPDGTHARCLPPLIFVYYVFMLQAWDLPWSNASVSARINTQLWHASTSITPCFPSSCLPPLPSLLSLLPPLSSLLFFLFLASSAFEPADCMNHQPLSENKISSLNGQRAFSALLSKSMDLNKQVLQRIQQTWLKLF